MKKYILTFVLSLLLIVIVIYNDKLSDYLCNTLINKPIIVNTKPNEYKKNYDFRYVKNSDDFVPYGYHDLINLIYTVFNNGYDTFTFYCPSEYKDCTEDIKMISKDDEILTDINNYVHPFNNFSNLTTIIDSSGQITMNITHVYTNEQITKIKEKVKIIENEIYDKDDDLVDKLKKAHDYIINNSSYDMDRKNKNSTKYASNIAYGPLFEGKAICSGYADAMAIFITNLGIKNYKVASNTHVWNAVYIDNEWLHIDVTWDEQIDVMGKESLIHKFFLINSDNLKKYATTDHEFNESVYREFFHQ